jgi:hypothetical protein
MACLILYIKNVLLFLWQYIKNLLIWIDQGFNVVLGGYPDETLSSRAYRAWIKNRVFGNLFKPLIDTLFFFDPDHCFTSYLSEKQRKQQPLDLRS